MRVLVCGGRNFTDYKFFKLWMDVRFPIRDDLVIITGMATGADIQAFNWAFEEELEVLKYPANWTKYGRAAGLIRNKQMLDEGKPDLVIAFPGGRGTADMVSRARKAGVNVEIVTYK